MLESHLARSILIQVIRGTAAKRVCQKLRKLQKMLSSSISQDLFIFIIWFARAPSPISVAFFIDVSNGEQGEIENQFISAAVHNEPRSSEAAKSLYANFRGENEISCVTFCFEKHRKNSEKVQWKCVQLYMGEVSYRLHNS